MTGMREAESAAKTRLFDRTDRALAAIVASHTSSWMHWFVPGRIEVLGKHTDYAGGRSLLCAVERGFCVSAAPRRDDLLRVVDVINDVDVELRVSEAQADELRWRNYPATVARRVARNFAAARTRGADIVFASDLPRASGLSSSSALVIAIFSVLAEVNALDRREEYLANIPDDDALASYLGCVENGRTFGTLAGDRGVGTQGGSQDHLAIIGSRPRQLVDCRFSPVRREQFLPLPDGHTFVIASSGVTSSKTGAALARYNRAAFAVAAILGIWRRARGRDDATLFDAVASEPSAIDRLRDLIARSDDASSAAHAFTGADLVARLEQFRIETFDVIPRAIDALAAAGDLTAFGTAVDRSQAAAAELLGNQTAETMALAHLARTSGAVAASAFGAGFGGSVWALVGDGDAPDFLADWRGRYLARFPAHVDTAEFFLSGAGPGRTRL